MTTHIDGSSETIGGVTFSLSYRFFATTRGSRRVIRYMVEGVCVPKARYDAERLAAAASPCPSYGE